MLADLSKKLVTNILTLPNPTGISFPMLPFFEPTFCHQELNIYNHERKATCECCWFKWNMELTILGDPGADSRDEEKG